MSEDELDKFEILESRLRANMNKTLYKIALGALGVIVGFAVLSFMGFTDHGERLSTVEEVSGNNKIKVNNILDETGVEFVVRRVVENKLEAVTTRFNLELDEKADKSAFEQFDEKLDIILEWVNAKKETDNE